MVALTLVSHFLSQIPLIHFKQIMLCICNVVPILQATRIFAVMNLIIKEREIREGFLFLYVKSFLGKRKKLFIFYFFHFVFYGGGVWTIDHQMLLGLVEDDVGVKDMWSLRESG